VDLTEREFFERCFAAIDEDNIVAQLAILVDLYWNAESKQLRWGLFETTCLACGTNAKAMTLLALKSRISNRDQ
jgi:hypothetical protein